MTDLVDPADVPDACRELGRLKSGVDYELEELADELLAQAKRDRSFDGDDYEVLSAGQLARRQSREIYNKNGVPEPHLFSGMYRRAYNPQVKDRPPKEEQNSSTLEW